MLDPELVSASQPGPRSDEPKPAHPNPTFDTPSLDPSWGYDLNLLSHAASHVASTGQSYNKDATTSPDFREDATIQARQLEQSIPQYDPKLLSVSLDQQQQSEAPPIQRLRSGSKPPDLADSVQDFDDFLDKIGLSSELDNRKTNKNPTDGTIISRDHQNVLSPFSQANSDSLPDPRAESQARDSSSFPRFTSQLSLLEPGAAHDPKLQPFDTGIPVGSRVAQEVSEVDYQTFATRVAAFEDVLPKSFTMLSHHTLSMYLANYFRNFHELLPFIHVPTFSIASQPPELVLSLAAIGSHCQSKQCSEAESFYSAKELAIEHLRRREHLQSSFSSTPQVQVHNQKSRDGDSIPSGQTSRSVFRAGLSDADLVRHLATIQSLLLLTMLAIWGKDQNLVREAIAFQGTLVRLVRENSLTNFTNPLPVEGLNWEEWIQAESIRRTVFAVYCVSTLSSFLWSVPLLITNADMKLHLPGSAACWRAGSVSQWQRSRHAETRRVSASFPEAFSKLFIGENSSSCYAHSFFGNHILIHALIQHISFARQLSISRMSDTGASLREEDVNDAERALSNWKQGWERTADFNYDPPSYKASIASTSTALFTMAHMRLYLDIRPFRYISSYEPQHIALALYDSPRLERHPRLIIAVLHAAHAFSVTIRFGLKFISEPHNKFWSVQRAFCNLEGASLLSKWLAALATGNNVYDQAGAQHISNSSSFRSPDDALAVSEHESNLLLWIRGMIDQTHVDISQNCTGIDGSDPYTTNGNNVHQPHHERPNLSTRHTTVQALLRNPVQIRQMSAAIVRIWANTFKNHTSWPVVDLIGSALSIYASMLERDAS